MEFSGKVVLITGASSGIGAATAKKFADLSADLALVGRNVENLGAVAKDCIEKGSHVLTIAADISIDSEVERIVKETIETFGKIDVLVNNAGISQINGILDGIATYDTTMATNIRAVYLITSLAAPHIINSKGSIINVSSMTGSKTFDKSLAPLAYSMSKAAMNMFTQAVALELAPHGVRVNSLSPGGTITNIQREFMMTKEEVEDLYKYLKTAAPLKRISVSNEMADMIVYVAGWKARGMTGSNILIDNGLTLN